MTHTHLITVCHDLKKGVLCNSLKKWSKMKHSEI